MSHGFAAPEHRQTATLRIVAYLTCVSVSILAALLLGFHGGVEAPKKVLAYGRISALPAEIQPKLLASYGKLPLGFEANQGQVRGPVKFLSRGHGYTIFLTDDEAVLTLRKSSVVSGQSSVRTTQSPSVAPTFRSAGAGLKSGVTTSVDKPTTDNGARRWRDSVGAVREPPLRRATLGTARSTTGSVLRMKLVGANAKATVTGAEELPGKSNYFFGNDPKKWRTNVPTYAKVKYAAVYPGVDLVYYGNQRQLEYDFVVAPGADPTRIKLSFAGAEGMRVDAVSGDLVLKLGEDEVRFHKPVVYQPAITVAAVYDPRTPGPKVLALECGSLLPLCAPQLAAGFSGGRDAGAIDAAPEASFRRGKRQQAAALQSGLRPQMARLDGAFVAASNNEVAFRVAGYDPKRALVIDPVLSYSTYLGGSANDIAYAIAVDSGGNAYVTGNTQSSDFPTANPFQPACISTNYESCNSAFVAKLNPAGNALVYSTYLGGSAEDYGSGIAADGAGNAYVTGTTESTDFPTVNPLQPCPAQGFVAMFNPTGSALVYSTCWVAQGNAIAVDASGDAYVTGLAGINLLTVNPLQPSPGGSVDAFVSKIIATVTLSPTSLSFSDQMVGATSPEQPVTLSNNGNAHLTISSIAITGSVTGDFAVAAAGTTCSTSAALAAGTSCTIDVTFTPTIVGSESASLSVSDGTASGPQTVSLSGTGVLLPAPNVSPTNLSFNNEPVGNTSTPKPVTVTNTGGEALSISSLTISSGWTQTNNCLPSIAASASCTISVSFQPIGAGFQIGALTLTDLALESPQTVSLSGTGVVPVVSLSATSLSFPRQTVSTPSPPQTLTLTNTGAGALTPLSITTSGDFSQTNTCAGSVAGGPVARSASLSLPRLPGIGRACLR
jgi:hypothetical protein